MSYITTLLALLGIFIIFIVVAVWYIFWPGMKNIRDSKPFEW